MKELIFDLGANVGGNIPYYLTKAKKVICVEANPVLCKKLKTKYAQIIDQGKLVIVEACLTINQDAKDVKFYIHKFKSGLSTFCTPNISFKNDYLELTVKAVTYEHLIHKYGNPDFVKIDLEGYDKVVLDYMIRQNMLPDYLQFENQGFDMLQKIIDLKIYNSYNIVTFYNFSKFYDYNHERNAGPLGTDIKSPWLSGEQLIKLYKTINHPWLDIHLTRENFIADNRIDYNFYYYKQSLFTKIKLLIPHTLKSKVKILLFKN